MEKELKNIVDEFVFREEDTRKLKCKDAFEIADRLDIPIGSIGKFCNNNNIKLASCQLGCF
jgi:hypothetical protein